MWCCVSIVSLFLSKALTTLACAGKRVLYHQMKSSLFFQEHLAMQRKTWNRLELSRKSQISVRGQRLSYSDNCKLAESFPAPHLS